MTGIQIASITYTFLSYQEPLLVLQLSSKGTMIYDFDELSSVVLINIDVVGQHLNRDSGPLLTVVDTKSEWLM